ncbi:MAG TPA: hypothetical protein VJQ82_02645 [Terriglobales bacterium]|nr:hypothetical protein [Terriglobales bacterium]
MRPILAADTLQIEWTARCVLSCSNCTHFSGSFYDHPQLTFEQFKAIVDSLDGYLDAHPNGMIGAIGGDPLVHPEFEKFCLYAQKKIPRERHGLWTTFPKGKEHFAPLICETFGNILLNDHTIPVKHAPILVGIEEMIPAEEDIWPIVDRCWLGNHWSPVVNTKGAFFCEVAGSMAQLFQTEGGWELTPGWWKKVPKDYTAQMEEYCRKCGCAAPLERRQSHTAGQRDIDDISPRNLERLKGKSRKVDKGLVAISDFKIDSSLVDEGRFGGGQYPAQEYKNSMYRQGIAARYGILLVLNSRGYWEPTMMPEGYVQPPPPPEPLFQIAQAQSTAPKQATLGYTGL